MSQIPGIHAYEKPVENDFEYVYTENKSKGFRKVTKAMMKVLLGVATKLSELENDTGFIDKTVADLKNYYLKTETYSKKELDDKIALIPKFSVKVVYSLPFEDIDENTIYLVPANDGSDNLYTEYINVNGLWEILGTQKVPKVEVTKESIESALGYTPADEQKLSQLSDTVNDLKKGQTSGISADLTGAFVNYFTHVMPNFDDTNGLSYVNAILTALGAETRGEAGGEEEPDTPVEPDEPEITLTSISATYEGGEVAVGTALTDLTGITVKATYSDDSIANVTGYTLSGEIVEGSNTITVSYGGKTTTFTVTGIAESGGGEDTRTLLYNWDFTQGLVDSVGGVTATLSGATQDSEGLKLATGNDYCSFDEEILKPNRTIEIDVANTEKCASGNHFRFITVNNDRGLIYRSNTSWQLYNGTWTGVTTHTDGNMFSGKTLIMEIDSTGKMSVLCDGVVVGEQDFSNLIGETLKPAFAIGSSSGSYYNATISGIRIYEGV